VRWLYVAAVVGFGVLLTACGSGTIASHGVIQVQESCSSASSDYPDVDQGAQVVVTNSTGAVIDTSQLDAGRQKNLAGFGSFAATCNYPFALQVPGGLARYGVTVSHRGTIWFSARQMQNGPGLTLGGS
jgi:hypothetical protein